MVFFWEKRRNPANVFPKDSTETCSLSGINFGSFPPGIYDLCIVTPLKGDVNMGIDTSYSKLVRLTANTSANLAIANVKIFTPATNAMKEYKTSQSLDEISFTVKNAGTTTLPSGTAVPVGFTVGALAFL